MKIFILPILLLSSLAFFSCQKEAGFQADANADSTNQATSGNFVAKIDGVQFIANAGAVGDRYGGTIAISGVDKNNNTIIISLRDSGVHKYILSDVSLNVGVYSDGSGGNAFATNEGEYPTQCGGEVNITGIDESAKKIRGNFLFKVFRAEDEKMVTISEGSFDLPYRTALPPSGNTDTFRVKINGIDFVPANITAIEIAQFNQINIGGTTADASKSVGLGFPADIAVGNYSFDFFGFTYFGSYNPDASGTNAQASVSGSLTILEKNPITRRIRGNFNFVSESLINSGQKADISAGYFSVKY